jgi:hypothetical protein
MASVSSAPSGPNGRAHPRQTCSRPAGGLYGDRSRDPQDAESAHLADDRFHLPPTRRAASASATKRSRRSAQVDAGAHDRLRPAACVRPSRSRRLLSSSSRRGVGDPVGEVPLVRSERGRLMDLGRSVDSAIAVSQASAFAVVQVLYRTLASRTSPARSGSISASIAAS